MTVEPIHAHVNISAMGASLMERYPELRESFERQCQHMAERRGWVPPFCIHVVRAGS